MDFRKRFANDFIFYFNLRKLEKIITTKYKDKNSIPFRDRNGRFFEKFISKYIQIIEKIQFKMRVRPRFPFPW